MSTGGYPLEPDWTYDGTVANSSPEFLRLCDEVERLIRGDAHALIDGRADSTARLIMANLAHKHGLAPTDKAIPAENQPMAVSNGPTQDSPRYGTESQ